MTSSSGPSWDTLVLACDFQPDILRNLPDDTRETLLTKVTAFLDQARKKSSVQVGFVRVAFRPEHPEINTRNKIFAMTQKNNFLVEGTVGAAVHDKLAPLASEFIFTKRRFSAFKGTDLDLVLSARPNLKLVLFGVSTGGVVLSTVREAFDRDVGEIVVLEDLCADRDPAQHDALIKIVLPKQATVTTSAAFLESLP